MARRKKNALCLKDCFSQAELHKAIFSLLGPGLITGAADDDSSGIATYSIAGAQMGTALL
jgi:Mn2+/Fe2+ NRAMP family transporter